MNRLVRNQTPLIAALVAVSWLVFAHRQILAPWLWGIDPYTRLFHIDETILVVKGNAWLPLLQLVLRGVHAISDTSLAYKLTISVCSALGIFFFFLVVARWLGLAVALLASTFFFLNGMWLLVGTSLYMETLLLFFVSAAFYLHGRPTVVSRVAASVCLLGATLSRPEMLMAAPLLVAGHFVYYRRWRRAGLFALHFLPVAAYYLAVKLWIPEFEAAGVNEELSVLRRARELVDAILWGPTTTVALVLSVLGLALALSRDSWLSRLQKLSLKLLAAGLPLYLVIFSVTLPEDYSFRPRFSLQFVLPLFLLAAVGVESLRRMQPKVLTPLAALLLAVALAFVYRDYRDNPPPAHRALSRLLEAKQRLGYPENSPFVLCRPDPRHTNDDLRRSVDQVALVGVTLRLAGQAVQVRTCAAEDQSWRTLAAKRTTPLLRVYRPDLINKDYEAEYTRGCQFNWELRHRRRVEATVCF